MFAFLLWCILFVLCWPLASIGAGLISICLAVAAAVPHRRRSGAWCAGDYLCGDYATVPAVGSALQNLATVGARKSVPH